MNPELKDLMDARTILARAHLDTIGMWPAQNKVWHALEYLDKQITPMIAERLADPEPSSAAVGGR